MPCLPRQDYTWYNLHSPPMPKLSPGMSPTPQPTMDIEELRTWCEERGLPLIAKSTFDKWTFGSTRQELGEGAFGACYKLNRLEGPSLVIKHFTRGGEAAVQDLKDEVQMLNACQGEGVQKLVGVCPENQALVTDFAGQSLGHLLDGGLLDESEKLDVLGQVMNAASRGLKRKICHNDIRENNVCVKKRKTGVRATLIDYGLASLVGDNPFVGCDSVPWVAPELFRDGVSSSATDTYSLGHLARELEPHDGFYPEPLSTWVKNALNPNGKKRPRIGDGIRYVQKFRRSIRPLNN